MGLGVPVCQHCQVIAEHKYNDIAPFHLTWCKYCGERHITDYSGLNEERWEILAENQRRLDKFYNFVKGIDNDNNN
jgi:NMD protein affecting ribosome stability and mRNA decay